MTRKTHKNSIIKLLYFKYGYERMKVATGGLA